MQREKDRKDRQDKQEKQQLNRQDKLRQREQQRQDTLKAADMEKTRKLQEGHRLVMNKVFKGLEAAKQKRIDELQRHKQILDRWMLQRDKKYERQRALKEKLNAIERERQAKLNEAARVAREHSLDQERIVSNIPPPTSGRPFQQWMLRLFQYKLLPDLLKGMKQHASMSVYDSLMNPNSNTSDPCAQESTPDTMFLAAHQATVYTMAQLRAKSLIDTAGLLVVTSTGGGKTAMGLAIALAFWNKKTSYGQPWPILLVSTNDNQDANNTRKLADLAMKLFPDFVDTTSAEGPTRPFAKPQNAGPEYWKQKEVIDRVDNIIIARIKAGIHGLMRHSRPDAVRQWTDTHRSRVLYTYAKLGNDLGVELQVLSHTLSEVTIIMDEVQYLISPPETEAKSFEKQYALVERVMQQTRDPRSSWVVGMTATPGETKEEVVRILNAVVGRKRSVPIDASLPRIAEAALGHVSYAYLLGDHKRFAPVSLHMVCSYLEGSYYMEPYFRKMYRKYGRPRQARPVMPNKITKPTDKQKQAYNAAVKRYEIARDAYNERFPVDTRLSPQAQRYLASLSNRFTWNPQRDNGANGANGANGTNGTNAPKFEFATHVSKQTLDRQKATWKYSSENPGAFMKPLKEASLYIQLDASDMEHLHHKLFATNNANDNNNSNLNPRREKARYPLVLNKNTRAPIIQELVVMRTRSAAKTHANANADANTNTNANANNQNVANDPRERDAAYVARAARHSHLENVRRAPTRRRNPGVEEKVVRFLLSPKIPQFLAIVYRDILSVHNKHKGIHYVYTSNPKTALLIAHCLKTIMRMPHIATAADIPGARNGFVMLDAGTKDTYTLLAPYARKVGGKEMHQRLLDLVSGPGNEFGQKVKVVIATKKSFKGVDLKHIRFLHLLDPMVNFRDFVQFVGRGPRYCSHLLHNAKGGHRYVKVYLYRLLLNRQDQCKGPAEALSDCFLWDLSVQRFLETGGYKDIEEKVLWGSSVDYCVFKDNLHTSRDSLIEMIKALRCEPEGTPLPSRLEQMIDITGFAALSKIFKDKKLNSGLGNTKRGHKKLDGLNVTNLHNRQRQGSQGLQRSPGPQN